MQYFMEESPPERTKAISINCIDADTRMVNTSNKEEKGKFFTNKLTFVFDKKKKKLRYFPNHAKRSFSLFFFLLIQYLRDNIKDYSAYNMFYSIHIEKHAVLM